MALFDFNRDGTTSFGEEVLGFGLLGMICDDIAAAERQQAHEDANDEIYQQIAELENQRDELEDQLSCLEDDEPDDITTPAYERWEERHDALEALISDLDDEITDLKALLED